MFDILQSFSIAILSGLLVQNHINVHALPMPTANNTHLENLFPRSHSHTHSKVTGSNSNIFYQAVYGPELGILEKAVDSTKNPHPRSMKRVRGDFNVEATPGFYMWDNFANADAWCSIKKKRFKNCRIAKFKWVPPKGLKLKRFNSGDDQWQKVSGAHAYYPSFFSISLRSTLKSPLVSSYGGIGINLICTAERRV
jgi:hypothetical protein